MSISSGNKNCYLHYNGPGSTGFGVKRTAMLLPESAMLMVSPMGCGRSGTVVAEKFDFSHRMFYLNLDDRTIASGAYLKNVKTAVEYIKNLGEFKVVIICMTCIDALTGTDLAGLGKKLSREVGIPITTTFMDPIVRDGNFGPMVQVRKAITDCMENSCGDGGNCGATSPVNFLGLFTELSPDCEIIDFLKNNNIEIKTVPSCKTFEDLKKMGNSRANIVIHPQSVVPAEDLEKRLGIPMIKMFPEYCPENVAKSYDELKKFLKIDFDYTEKYNDALKKIEDFKKDYSGMKIAVGEAIFGSPFRVAELLSECGVEVPFVFRDRVQDFDRVGCNDGIGRGEPKIFSGVNPETVLKKEALPDADAVLGLDAGYFLPNAKSIAWNSEKTHFGFEGIGFVLDLIRDGIENPKSHKSQMTGSYLTV